MTATKTRRLYAKLIYFEWMSKLSLRNYALHRSGWPDTLYINFLRAQATQGDALCPYFLAIKLIGERA